MDFLFGSVLNRNTLQMVGSLHGLLSDLVCISHLVSTDKLIFKSFYMQVLKGSDEQNITSPVM